MRLAPCSRIRWWHPVDDALVTIPGIDHDVAQRLADTAHQTCPYSNATRGNIDVLITVSDD